MNHKDRARIFVEELAAIALPNVFNPYTEVCTLSDQANAPAIRRENVEQALCSALTLGVTSVWIAQDLGYRGGRRTGLALTDEAHLHQHGQMLNVQTFKKATHGPEVRERTATVIWHALQSIKQPVFLWNVFPFHPHLPSDPMSNRCHDSRERVVGLQLLSVLLEALQPSVIVTIGEKAGAALRSSNVITASVRHPSYGGQTAFLEGVATIYDCDIPISNKTYKSEPLQFAEV
jgi:hypothetical protein